MSKRKHKNPMVIESVVIFNAQKTKWNGFGCGHGLFKNKKAYDRKDKSWKKEW